MTRHRAVLDAALSYAAIGWPVFPCQPGRKAPATAHGYLDATTDPEQITRWFMRHPSRNLAIATGTPGPDVLDVDQHGPAGNGFAALSTLHRAGLLDGAAAYIRTPSGGLHAYFTGSAQRNGHLPAHHLDFRSHGGYILAPPSRIGDKPYQLLKCPGGTAGLDWADVTQLLEPRAHLSPKRQPGPRHRLAGADIGRLATWIARLEPGNRNEGLFWAANRVLEHDHAADLRPLAAAAGQAGLDDREISSTLESARKTAQPSASHHPHHQAEAN